MTTETPTATSASCDDSTFLFGSAPSQFFDDAADAVDAALRDGVSSLPFFRAGDGCGDDSAQPTAGDARLLSTLRAEYGRNLEIAQAFAERQLFAFPGGYSRRRKARLAEEFLSENARRGRDEDGASSAAGAKNGGTDGSKRAGDGDDPDDEGEGDHSKKEAAKTLPLPKSRDDIPPPAALSSVDDEIASLRQRLRSVRRAGLDLRSVLDRTRRSRGAASVAQRAATVECGGEGRVDKEGAEVGGTVANSMALRESVTAVVVGREGLETLRGAAEGLVATLDDENAKAGGEDDGGEIDLGEVRMEAQQRRRAREEAERRLPTLEEDYEERKRKVGADRKGLEAISIMINSKKRKQV